MKAVQRKRWNHLLTAVTAAGMTVLSAMLVMASPASSNGGVQDGARQVITEIDFSDMASLDSLPGGWKVECGEGTASLADSGMEDGKKALKLTRTSGGATTQLYHDSLGIEEQTYPYVSLEARIKLSPEAHEHQWNFPYVKGRNNEIAYTLFTDEDWKQIKTHVNGKNVKTAAATKLGEWQDIRMDIDLKKDTFRLFVDGACVLYDEKARSAADGLKTVQFYADSWNFGTVFIQSVKITGQKEHSESAVYYVSSTGDDNAAGTSESTAWKSLSRVNQEHYIPGDKILFQSGGEWENETLFPHGSGNKNNWITIGSYGEGDMPEISANGMAPDAVFLYNQEYWEIYGLDISNTVEGFTQLSGNGSGDGTAPEFNNAGRVEEQGKKLGDYRGIHIAGRDVRTLKGYHLHDLKVHDVTGVVAWIGNTGLNDAGIKNNWGLDGSKRTGGILIECLAPTGNQPTQFSDITIEKSEFINNSFCGITIKQWHGSGDQYASKPGWDTRNGNNGKPDYYSSNWYPHSNIIIQDNYINQGASAYACNGIYLTSSRDSVIQRNVLEHIGTCGIELYFADNVAVQYNEIYDVIHKGGGADDNAIDPDWRVTNALIQYNYIHEAGEGFLLCGVQFNSGVIRYNLVQDCKTSYVHYSMGNGYFQIYNNVFYRSKDGNGTNRFDPWGGGAASYVNNVFYDGKKEGFQFSGGSSFAYNNNAYYGTDPTPKDGNPIILTEDPFVGTAPSLDRMGNFSTGVLLEANGLMPKADSPLVGAGVVVDTRGINLDNGLKSKGTEFNFSALDKADTAHLGECINMGRTDYPLFDGTGADAAFDTPKTQRAADNSAPTIGIFEVPIDKNAVILRGTVTDGVNAVAEATVEVRVGDKMVTATTNESGAYAIMEGLQAGEAIITAHYGENGELTESANVTLESGKVNRFDIMVPLADMPEGFEYTVLDETFDEQTSPENFGFDRGTDIAGGKLVLTKTGTMGNATTAVKKFGPEISGQKKIDVTFDYLCTAGNKQGFEFRDSEGRLLFAICAAADKNDLRPSVKGAAAGDSEAASKAEPEWNHIAMNKNTTYQIHVNADFTEKLVSYSVAEADGTIAAYEINVPTEAANLSKMIACSWWDSKSQYIDNFKVTAPKAEKGELRTLAAQAEKEVAAAECYTEESVEQLKKALEEAKNVLEDEYATDEEVSAQITALSKALEALSVSDSSYETYEIRVTRKPDKLEYKMNEEFNPDGMEVTAYEMASCSNAKRREKKLDREKYKVDCEPFDTEGEKTVTVTYSKETGTGGIKTFADSFTVTVKEAEKSEDKYYALNVRIEREPDKTVYEVGDEFDAAGMKVTVREKASPSNAVRTRTLDEDEYEVEHESFDTPGNRKVTVIYQAENKDGEEEPFTASFTVKVTEAWDEFYTTGIKVRRKPDKTTYQRGEEFDPTGMKVVAFEKASSSNASRRERVLTEDEYDVEFPSFETPGTKKVRVVYGAEGKNGEDKVFYDSFNVKVVSDYSSDDSDDDDDGSRFTVWQPDDSVTGEWFGGQDRPWRFRKSDGTYAVNEWVKIKSLWYYFDSEGSMEAGWIFVGDKWYLLSPDGIMYADIWALVGDKWYFLNADGSMKCNEWHFYKEKWYYLGADGSMMTGGKTPDGYLVDEEGCWVQ